MGFVRDEDLEWGPEWIEERIRVGLLGYHDMPPLGVGRVVPEEYFVECVVFLGLGEFFFP